MRWGTARLRRGLRISKGGPRAREREFVEQRIHAVVDSIPRGRVATYGDVAREAGLPRRARLVGRVLSQLPAGSGLPWHRVVNAAGRLSPRPGGTTEQRRRLGREGVAVSRAGRVDLARLRWPDA
jgi:methylated-DNA-protein-cysteine methyltransferase-like protein